MVGEPRLPALAYIAFMLCISDKKWAKISATDSYFNLLISIKTVRHPI